MTGKLEIEAKFKIADWETFSHALQEEQLGPFRLKPAPTFQVEDIYQDTAENHLHQAGYGCRIRRIANSWVATLKEQAETGDMIHKRMELSVDLPYLELDPLRWPDSDARQLAIQLSGGAILRRLFTIRQVRHTRIVTDEQAQDVAELSLDEVHITMPGISEKYFELELELLSDKTTDVFHEMVDLLKSRWALEPQAQSKFLRAMSLFQPDEDDRQWTASSPGMRVLPADRPVLECIVEMGRALYARRARLLLSWDEGADIQVMRDTSGYSRSSVYHWLHTYQQDGMTVFPKQVIAQAEQALMETTMPPLPGEPADDDSYQADSPQSVRVSELYDRYGVDMGHARQVATLALDLFDATQSVHRLPPSSREVLEWGGLLHNVGLNADPDRHHTAGRDIILQTPIAELAEDERLMVAAIVYLHRKQITLKKLQKKTVLAVPERRRKEMLDLAALVRIADGLDYSQSQSTRIVETNATPAVIEIILEGPYAVHDAARAEQKTDLWNLIHPVRFYFRTHNTAPDENPANASGPETLPEADSEATAVSASPDANGTVSYDPPLELDVLTQWVGEEPGVLADDRMSEAGRKLLRFHFYRMLQHEAGTREGSDIEELHDMRVAIRRMRSAARLVSDFFVPKDTASLIKGLRRTARILGAVRDLDVLIDKATRYQKSLPSARENDLAPLLASWAEHRETARQEMISHLDGDSYPRFVRAFTQFVTTEGAGAQPIDPNHPHPCLVCHVVPRLLYTHFEAVRAYEQWLNDPPLERLHALRIDCKRLRYALEFFREVLGPESKLVIKEVIALQDHLGELHDADVADHLLRDFLDGGMGILSSLEPSKKKQAYQRQRIMAPGVALYLAEKQTELQTLVSTFPEAWAHFNRLEVRQSLAAAVAIL